MMGKEHFITFTSSEMDRLKAIFPNGVCDFSNTGVNRTATVSYPSFGPSTVNKVFDVTQQ